ncbi:RING-H2 finger protein ATL43-like [Andrographis paniculata]|uniref:RING-H2 finger protein ATL43-like n=1 Tax=Andrographis paniculata TaxID=175694 RepID=UPI0021E8A8C0|nr:RING-H2 finger protein ATL43-like [Andrographis paniculata]
MDVLDLILTVIVVILWSFVVIAFCYNASRLEHDGAIYVDDNSRVAETVVHVIHNSWNLDLLVDRQVIVLDNNVAETSDHCAICLYGYKEGELLATLKECGHKYHVVCVKTWLDKKNTCPLCRTRVIE